MKAIEVLDKWNEDLEAKIEALLKNAPEADSDFRDYCLFPNRRGIAVKNPEGK